MTAFEFVLAFSLTVFVLALIAAVWEGRSCQEVKGDAGSAPAKNPASVLTNAGASYLSQAFDCPDTKKPCPYFTLSVSGD